jgi:hypothetical protein
MCHALSSILSLEKQTKQEPRSLDAAHTQGVTLPSVTGDQSNRLLASLGVGVRKRVHDNFYLYNRKGQKPGSSWFLGYQAAPRYLEACLLLHQRITGCVWIKDSVAVSTLSNKEPPNVTCQFGQGWHNDFTKEPWVGRVKIHHKTRAGSQPSGAISCT